jgi:protein-export membrane protein SecD
MQTHWRWFVFIVVLALFSLYVALPADVKGVTPDDPVCERLRENPRLDSLGVRCSENITIDLNGDRIPEIDIRVIQSLGLDLVGGLRVLLQADVDTSAFSDEELRAAMGETANNINRRVNGLGLTEATVQLQGRDRVLVELPGVRNREQAINTIQQTALLEFVDMAGLRGSVGQYVDQFILTTGQLQLAGQQADSSLNETLFARLRDPQGNPFTTAFTGSMLERASAQFGALSPASPPQWYISFQVRPEFQAQFAEYTGARIGEPMAIVLDGLVLSAPIIEARLSDGGVITGSFTEEEARTLALQLQSGALPIPLRVVTAEEVGATLGQNSVIASVRAGLIGVFVVLSFMVLYYRLPGLAASCALVVFMLLNLALFKLLPVTLTLPAITGFLISIGTAVDGNILIFERIKEELRAGKDINTALKAGFERAWTSIRDSNTSTIIIGMILFFFGQTPGASIVSGFAITLILGLILNLFTAVIVTRTFLYIFVSLGQARLAANRWLLGV